MWRSIRVRFALIYVLLILFALELVGAYFVRTLTTSLIRNQTQTVENQAHLLATLAAPAMSAKAPTATGVGPVLSSFPQFLNGTVYLLNKDGVVISTSAGGALIGQKRTDSVATKSLLERSSVVAIRFDPLANEHFLAVAVPITSDRSFIGLVEYVVPIQATYNTVRQVTTIFYTGSGLVLLLTLVLGFILARTVTRPVLDVTRQAQAMAKGDFSKRVVVRSDDEFGELAMTINNLTEKLEAALNSSAREQERLRAVMRSMGEGVLAFNAQFQIMFLNEAAERVIPEELRKNSDELLRVLHLREFAEDEEFAKNETYMEDIGKSILHIQVTRLVQQKRDDGYVVVLRDITEQEKLNEARRDFVANVSHELRTPLTSIKSYLEAIEDLPVDDTNTKASFMQVLHQETDRMVRLTRDLLQLSGLDTQPGLTHRQLISLRELLARALERFRLTARRRNIHLLLVPADDVYIYGNQDMLDRVLDNLLTNALNYTSEDGRVELSAKALAGYAEIRVTDTGVGIPQTDLPHVFERFYRVDKGRSRRLGGTGLGLALAREITERHSGSIRVESTSGEGTQVIVRLPLMEGEGSTL